MIAPGFGQWADEVLSHPDTGVNALLLTVPGQPMDAPPPVLRIVNVFDDAGAATAQTDGESTPDVWTLYLRAGLEGNLAGHPAPDPYPDICTLVLHLEGIAANGDTPAMVAQAARAMRAVRRSMTHAFRQLGNGSLNLEGQRIKPPKRWIEQIDDYKPGSGRVEMAYLLPCDITDTWAISPIPEPVP